MELLEGNMAGALEPITVSTKRQRIAKLAKESPAMVFTTLAHHIDTEWMHAAFRRTRKDGAVGVDGISGATYEANLDENLATLLEGFKSGTYRAPNIRRIHIPKGDGSKTRPIGIPTFEDKVLQRAVSMVLESVYEQDFLDCSYGFRPNRSAHQAIDETWKVLARIGGGFVVELDIQSFFDEVNPGQLRRFLDQRIRDGVLRKMIDKWLKAGVLEDGTVKRTLLGVPQGSVISPILSNIYLHEVLDKWFEATVRPLMDGPVKLIRYADDAVLIFSLERDAMRVMKALPKRFGKFGLTLHPEKTRLIDFRRPTKARHLGTSDKGNIPKTFDLLGFTHYWGKSKRGHWTVKRKTAKNRFNRAAKAIAAWCRRFRHMPVKKQYTMLGRKLKGHYAYYGITGNGRALQRFLHETRRSWRKWLSRRSQRGLTWKRFLLLEKRYKLPLPRVVHSVFARVANP